MTFFSVFKTLFSSNTVQIQEPEEETFPDGQRPVRIRTAIGHETEGTPFDIGAQIAISAGTQAEVTHTLGSDGEWMPESDNPLVWEDDTMDFRAYYPLRHTNSRGICNNASFTSFDVPRFQCGLPGGADHVAWADRMVFGGAITRDATSSVAAFPMLRQMARVNVKISDASNRLDAQAASLKCFVNSPTGIPLSNSWYALTGNTRRMRLNETTTVLVVPTEERKEQPFLLVLVYPNGNNSRAFNLAITGIPALEAGKSYTFHLLIGHRRLKVERLIVDDWTSGDIIRQVPQPV